MRERITSAHVLALIAIVLAVGGNAFAFTLGKNTVGSKQLKKNSVTTAKIKKEAVTAAKVRKGTLTGNQINASTLGIVPTAEKASTLAPPENWHEVGAAGEPGFRNSWQNAPATIKMETVAFYKDQEGVVHLKGVAVGGASTIVFQLPPSYRPASGKILRMPISCNGPPCGATQTVSSVLIAGPGVAAGADGAIVVPGGTTLVSFDGIDFRAES